MGFLNVGEKDRDGRQKRIEHRGRHLRASRTGGISLRAQTRVSGVNVTANSSHGIRLSTRLAKNTQVALQNGRFVLRGRYGSDAARLNLSKSGVTVSSKTPVGTFNWIKPGRSSFKLAGVQLRGHKAAYLQVVYALLAAAAAAVRGVLWLLASVVQIGARCAAYVLNRRQPAAPEPERLELDAAEVAAEGERIVAGRAVDLSREPPRDLFAALAFTVVCLGRGERRFDPTSAGMGPPEDAASHAFAVDVQVCGEQVVAWLGDSPEDLPPERVVAVMHALAAALSGALDASSRAETLLALDDACLASGPKTVLQEEMIDILAQALEVDFVLEGEP